LLGIWFFWDSGALLQVVTWAVLYIIMIGGEQKARKYVPNMVIMSSHLFENQLDFEKFFGTLKKRFNSKFEMIFCIVSTIFAMIQILFLYGCMAFFPDFIEPFFSLFNLEIHDDFAGTSVFLVILFILFRSFNSGYLIGLCASIAYSVSVAFFVFLKLDSKRFPVQKDYVSVKSGVFNKVIKILISYLGLCLIFTSIASICGLLSLTFRSDEIISIFEIYGGAFVSLYWAFLLIKSIKFHHDFIGRTKNELKEEIIKDMRQEMNNNSMGNKYNELSSMIAVYNDIEQINT
ncbi:MAG: hypothetical protein ACFFCS_30070, partial [Candidatus Hodarchaeota archaeon]